jgi:hypothetical protein
MPTPVAISNLIATLNPLGEEIDLEWTLPTTFPATWQIVLLRKLATAISPAEVVSFFAGNDPAGITSAVLEGVDGNDPIRFSDLDVLNDSTYHYSVFVQDTGTLEHSVVKATSGIPARSVTTKIIDAKVHVIIAVEKVMRAYDMIRDKHYQLLREYALPTMKPPTIYVTRIGGQVLQQYIGFLREIRGAQETYSELETDTIQVVWEDPNPKRRDTITNIFRENKEFFRQYLISENGADASIVDIHIEGDVINEAVRDRIQVGGMMIISCGIETEITMNSNLASWFEFDHTVEN